MSMHCLATLLTHVAVPQLGGSSLRSLHSSVIKKGGADSQVVWFFSLRKKIGGDFTTILLVEVTLPLLGSQ